MKLTPLRGKVREALLEYLEKRFGIERGAFDGLELMDNGKGRVFALSREAAIFALGNNIMSASLPFARLDGAVKPTSAMIQAFGRLAGSGVITLDRKRAIEFAEGYDIDVKGHGCTDGYVILKYQDRPLGCGQLRENKIKNMLPKAKRMTLQFL